MSTKRKGLLTVLVVGLLGSLAGLGVFAAFSSTTSNTGNSFAAGSVFIGDNDAGAALYNVSNQKPGVTTEKCIKVTYTGTLDANVRIYASAVAAGGQYVDLNVTSGTGDVFSCSDFAPDVSSPTVYNGTLKNFADTYTNYATGLADNPLAATKWVANDAVTYRFRVNIQDNDLAQGATTGTHSFTWETRNQ